MMMDIILVCLNQQQRELPWALLIVMVQKVQVFYPLQFLLALQFQPNPPNQDIFPQFPPQLPPPSPHFICLSDSSHRPQQFCHIFFLSGLWINVGLLSSFVPTKHVCVHHCFKYIFIIR